MKNGSVMQWALGVLFALILALWGYVAPAVQRVDVLGSQYQDINRRLERIENKLDRVMER